MKIYNNQQNLQSLYHILDPDYTYHTSYEAEMLYPFFKTLDIPRDVHTLAGIYIEYKVLSFPLEKYPYIYQKLSPHIQRRIAHHLNFGNANLYHNQTNMFFIVMFDISDEQISHAFLELKKELDTKIFVHRHKDCQINIKCGVYFSHTYIHPFDIYKSAKNQFQNAIISHKTSLSIKTLPFYE